ncbi:Crp/Fnr family transcriptional regulator [Desertifilum sp. FACHB-1129]|uniref:Crp/Fnr family transcriptional regulator n=1 Tax=Desertifilum tharense IPPAS B-1220 TaxID=1781255 RepID=A0A1E5QNK3_9CYAN|nr:MULTISPECIES: Crp/Fnr family transcriptional regulator [Desertifilum]MCD8489569.1 Crp/Fnr family transcriptional regulator [Desertifilum sp.]MDA0212223.1 Crp/Fnr family transcriptional regulator [Cyanobacteria bacterium FC1]MDI9635331.1 Crp/Fnr family transcriptional regulator [Geitlerinema splendidum]MBD2312802.1 Crp/Fnr family transcriptional regulator [Desertifilum sp. FACHB-1129]MBD2324166.1 Crp/Fnr family transcriptional regulator [Desertifilum sp. FACHB-866]
MQTSISTPLQIQTLLPQSFSRRSLIPLYHQRAWKIEVGIVRTLTWLEDGTVVPLGIWGSEDIVGGSLSQTSPYQIEALTDVKVRPLLLKDWQPSQEMFLNYLQHTQELMMIRSNRRAEDTLLKLLNWLANKFGSEVGNGYLINCKLTHQDLAEFSGLTRVTVTRILSNLEQQGLIHRTSRQLVVIKDEEVWHYQI